MPSPPARDSQGPELHDNSEHSRPSPPTQDSQGLELQDNRELRSSSPFAQVPVLQDTKWKKPASPPAKEKELHHTTRKRPPPPHAKDLHLHPSIEQPELLPNTDRKTHHPLPSTQWSVYGTAKDNSSSGFFVSEQKVQNIGKNACRQIFQSLEPFRKEVVVDEPNKDDETGVLNFFSCHKNINTRNH
jgi:hypothetical protein